MIEEEEKEKGVKKFVNGHQINMVRILGFFTGALTRRPKLHQNFKIYVEIKEKFV